MRPAPLLDPTLPPHAPRRARSPVRRAARALVGAELGSNLGRARGGDREEPRACAALLYHRAVGVDGARPRAVDDYARSRAADGDERRIEPQRAEMAGLIAVMLLDKVSRDRGDRIALKGDATVRAARPHQHAAARSGAARAVL